MNEAADRNFKTRYNTEMNEKFERNKTKSVKKINKKKREMMKK